MAEWSLAGVYVLAFVISSVAVFFDPCKLAILPDLVTKDQLIRANSLLATGETLTETVGYALAGFIAFYFARKLVFGIDAGTFVVSALALLAMRYAAPLRQGAELSARNLGREIREGPRPASPCRLAGQHDAGGDIDHRHRRRVPAHVFVRKQCVARRYPCVRYHGGLSRRRLLRRLALMAALGSPGRKGVAMTAGLALMGGGYASVAICTSLALVLVPIFVAGVANAAVLISIDMYFQQRCPNRRVDACGAHASRSPRACMQLRCLGGRPGGGLPRGAAFHRRRPDRGGTGAGGFIRAPFADV